jgi:hypothetical protein
VLYRYRDEQYLYVSPLDKPSSAYLRVRYNVPQVNDAFTETIESLWENASLNLLDYTIDNDVLTPDLFVVEPEYLLDVSAVAECFTEYGSHPAQYIWSRLRPRENTAPLLLGNIANLFLDEWLHAGETPDYRTTMQKVFRRYAPELTTCPDLQTKSGEGEFFQQCNRHFAHIRQVVQEILPDPENNFRPDDSVLEPSYICEALGLQGRLDYMQRDLSAFIEMKSGRAQESHDKPVSPKENNRVQMLLYHAMLHYEMGIPFADTKPYLLYTKYPVLFPAIVDTAKISQVINLRNRIVATEHAIHTTNQVGFTADRLDLIRPDVLNEKQLQGFFWERYCLPPIESFGRQLQTLTDTERDYFYRLYTFVTKELYLSKAGEISYEGNISAADSWLAPFETKKATGEILYDLRIVENLCEKAQQPRLIFHFPAFLFEQDTEILPNFRTGDAVVLYQRDSTSDNVTNRMVFKGNIEAIDETMLRLRLRSPQHNKAVLPADARYALEHDQMDSTFRTMFSGLSTYLTASPRRRAVLLGNRMPEVDVDSLPPTSAKEDELESIVQKAAAARDYFLLSGPPGTGKTSFALRRIVEKLYAEGENILLLAYTNRAVDEICKALSRIRPQPDFIRLGSELSCDPEFRPYLLEQVLKNCSDRISVSRQLRRCRLYVGTVATVSARTELFSLKQFDTAIVDEAGQVLEPHLVGLLCQRTSSGADAIGRFILIGDYKQLPAIVLQTDEEAAVNEPSLRALGITNLKDSLFQRLYRRLQIDSDSPHCAMLCKQGRMHPEVARFANRLFYGGHLQSLDLAHQTETSHTPRVRFYPSVPEPNAPKSNHSEAPTAVRLAKEIYDRTSEFDPNRTLGIITPFRSQIALIRKELRLLGITKLNDILIDTVERFQGSERDAIIYSFCLNQPAQLDYLANMIEDEGVYIDRKLNVALTRARKQLFLIGVPELLALNPLYRQLIESV